MELMVHLNDPSIIPDLIEIGIKHLIVGNEAISSRLGCSLSLEEITCLCDDFKIYFKMNVNYREDELDLVKKWLLLLKDTPITGIIFEDFGVLALVAELEIEKQMIYWPETLMTNHQTIETLGTMGVSKVMLAREIPLEDILQIQAKTTVPLICQVHGTMYMSTSRRRLLSNYAAYEGKSLEKKSYQLVERNSQFPSWIYEDAFGCHIESYQSLCAYEHLQTLKQSGIAYGFIDLNHLSPSEAVEICHIYQNGLMTNDLKVFKDYGNLLNQWKQQCTKGFYNDKTVYRLDDVREIDHERKH